MTVADLIAVLSRCPQGSKAFIRVNVCGEYGWTDEYETEAIDALVEPDGRFTNIIGRPV